jgi:hypothetical protein
MLSPFRRALAVAVGLVAVTLLPTQATAYQPESSYSDAAREIHAFLVHVELHNLAVQLGAEYVQGVQAQEAEAARLAAQKATQAVSRPSGSYTALAICEQGRNGQPYNHPFFGYFSIMDGSAGGKSWDEQVRMVQAIKARAGAGAWDGCARYVP